MQDEDNNIVDIDLADFEQDFYGTKEPEVKEEVEEVAETEEDNPLAPDEDEEDEQEEQEDEDSEEEEETPAPVAKKRNRTQERIEKLVAEARTAERERDALRIELERIRAETKEVVNEKTPALREQLAPEAPNPDAIGEDGNPIYELGEYDPKFIRDLTKFTIEQETKAAKEQADREQQERFIKAAQEEISNKWIDNLDKYEETNPNIRENIVVLTDTFQNMDAQYGEYLASTIMASDVGPQIMDYLSQNIGEAQKIVASGPAAATLALGRLEAKFLTVAEPEPKRNDKKVSAAPPPPVDIERARGRGGRFEVADDTDNLEAFERKFFQK